MITKLVCLNFPSTNLAFKSFDFSIFFSGTQGNNIFNLRPYYYENPNGGRNTFAAAYNKYWSHTNPSSQIQMIDFNWLCLI
jgi:hypothetical protein